MFLMRFAMDSFQFKESVRIVFVNRVFHYSPQINRECKLGRLWWPNAFWNCSVPEHIALYHHGKTSGVCSSTALLETEAGNFVLN
jgi:hypothetical protein